MINSMGIRYNFFLILFGAFWLIGCRSSIQGQDDANQPKDKNVLMIIVDDLKPTLGTYGDSLAITPNIDQLATAGVQFNRAYCNFAVCGPSRSSFLTGLRPETLGILDNVTPLQSVLGDKPTLPYLFKQNGFETIGIGKTFHDRDSSHEDPKAWDAYYKFQTSPLGETGEKRNVTNGEFPWCYWQAAEGTNLDQQDGQVAQKAVEEITKQRNKPFFLAVGLHKPHDPFVAPKEYFDKYPLEHIEVPELPEGWGRAYEHSLPEWAEVFDQMSDRDKKELKRAYYACTTFMDALVGQIIDALKESGQYDNTLIVFFGDHGYHLGEHGWWNKVTVYEEGVNAPFIMAGNAVGKKGIKSNAMFEFIDIYPTIAELMSLESVPDHLEGESFASVVADPELPFKEAVYGVTKRGDMLGRMIKTDHWRYIEWDEGRSGRELYNQVDDPLEYQNLATDDTYYQEVMSRLSDSLKSIVR